MAEGDNNNQNQNTGDPWYKGKVDDVMVGIWQNRGLHDKDAATVAIEMTKAHAEASKFLGVPANELARLPKAGDAEGTKALMQKLGAPADAKDYDFSSVKIGDKPLAEANKALEDMLRATAAGTFMPKDAATKLAGEIVGFLQKQTTAEVAAKEAALLEEKAALAKNWGANAAVNKLMAQNAAKALGIDEATVAALESVAGYSKVMEMFRQIGSKIGEDTFVGGGSGAGKGGVMTREQAIAKKNELMADAAWVARYMAGGTTERKEMTDLITIEVGE